MFCSDEFEKKQLVIKAGILLSQKGLVERTWGNVSVRLDEGHFAISPSGALYAKLKPGDVPVVNLKSLVQNCLFILAFIKLILKLLSYCIHIRGLLRY